MSADTLGRRTLWDGGHNGTLLSSENVRGHFGTFGHFGTQQTVNFMCFCVSGGQLDVFTFLLKRGARVCTALNGSTVLMEAVDKNQVDKVLMNSYDNICIPDARLAFRRQSLRWTTDSAAQLTCCTMLLR